MSRALRNVWWFGWVSLALSICALCLVTAMHAQTLRSVLHDAGATAVVLDVKSGRMLESAGDTSVRALPGSTLKPFVLLAAFRADTVSERSTMHCTGNLHVRGHNLACAHPRDITVLDARQALANSCNTYFAMLAQRMSANVLVTGLQEFGIVVLQTPRTPDDRVLLALGLEGVAVSPSQLAGSYRKLALAMNDGKDASVRVVRDGLVQSVQSGMAHAARADGVTVAGKTGTVDEGGGLSQGWFAGIVLDSEGRAQKVVVVYVPVGNGNDAAGLARRVLMRCDAKREGRRR